MTYKNEKELVKSFCESKFFQNSETLSDFLHPEVSILWNSSSGFYKMDFDKFKTVLEDLGKSFKSVSSNITHLIQEENQVSIRFSYNATPIEDPEEDVTLAYFMAIWELKDEKLYKGYLMSQPEDDSIDAIESFISKKD